MSHENDELHNAKKNEIIMGTITICGGGNGAHVAAAYLASKNITVNVLTRQPDRWSKSLEISTKDSSWVHKGVIKGEIHIVSGQPSDVIPKADLIIVAAPANAHPSILSKIAPHIKDGAILGALFGQGGFDWAANKFLGARMAKLNMIIGLQNIPWICQTVQYGHTARIIGPKKKLFVASYPVEKKALAAALIQELFDIPCKPVSNFLTLTLTPSNQIIHPARYYTIFRDWDGKKTYTEAELAERRGLTLYADFDESSAEQLSMLDNELQQIKAALVQKFPALDLSQVLPITQRIVKQYGCDVANSSSLRKVFATNRGYAGCATPLLRVQKDQLIPAVSSRLFWEDIPFGLCVLKCMAELLGNLPTPRIDFMIIWHQQFMNAQFLTSNGSLNPLEMWRTGTPYRYGIHDLQNLVNTSLPREMQQYRSPASRL